VNVKDAIYRAVHSYPGGAGPLAERMGLSVNTLRHMADPNKDTHNWSYRRWDELITFAGTGPLEAHCIQHGGVFVPMGSCADAPALHLLKRLSKLAAESGDVPRAIGEALKGDGRISDNELQKIEREILEQVQCGVAVLALVRSINASRAAVAEEQRP
jgi:hypothetical protein